MRRWPGVVAVWVVASLWPQVAAAQGHRGAPPGQLKRGAANPPAEIPPAEDLATGGPAVRSFGMWLDDATLAPVRSIWISAGISRWSTPIASGTELPSVNVAAGLRPRMQLSLAMSHSRAWLSSASEEVTSGAGNTYAGLKLLLVDRASHDVGLVVSPTLEILGADAVVHGSSRVNWILPVSFELGRGDTRVYGSAGYFSRGATFLGAAIERHLSPRLAATGSVMQSWSTSDPAGAAAYGLSRRRTDAGGGVAAFVSPRLAVYASIARTMSPLEFDSARYVVAIGMAVGFQVPPGILARPPR